MKIGIMTFWWSENNYGQLLQCFALQKYLRDMGHDVYLIQYDQRYDFIKLPLWKKALKGFNPAGLYKYLLYKKLKNKSNQEQWDNPRYFEDFRNKYIKQSENIYYSYKELVKNPPAADMYIAGSDQIWNTFGLPINRAKNVLMAYMLNFGDPFIKRISYAASFGREKIDNDFEKEFSPLLKNFNYVSVREKSGLDICEQCGIDNAEWVPDPTMLLDVNIYQELYKDEQIIKQDKPYCFLYLVGNEFNQSIKVIYKWAEKKDIVVVYVTGNNRHDKYIKTYAKIHEWIYLLEHAEYIITNSYHCSVFALLFKKKFCIIPKNRVNYGDTRFDSFFELFNLEKRYINSDFSALDKDINWQSVSSIFKIIKKSCKLNDVINCMSVK